MSRLKARWLQRLGGLSRLYELEGPRRIVPMEGVRGLAVLLVFFVHFHGLYGAWLAPGSASFAVSDFLARAGHSGVDLFFVVSGFLIYGAVIRRPVDYTAFMARRVQRIYPVFLCTFALYLLLSLAVPHASRVPADAVHAIVYLAANLLLLPGLFPIPPLITVAWTLSFEFFYYLAMPLLVAGLALRSWPRARRAALFAAMVAAYLAASALVGLPHVRMVLFLAGVLAYEAVHGGWKGLLGRREWVAALLLCASLPVAYLLTDPDGQSGLREARAAALFVVFIAVAIAAFGPPGRLSVLFSWTPLRWLGNMSYSYYLVHGLALHAVRPVLQAAFVPGGHSPAAFWISMPLAFLATLLTATAMFALVERPYSFPTSLQTGRGPAAARDHAFPAGRAPFDARGEATSDSWNSGADTAPGA